MTLALRPFGTMKVFPAISLRHAGPIAVRSTTRIDRVEWRTDAWGDATLHFGMGTYLHGPGAGHVNVRLALRTGDGVDFYFDYISRGDMDRHITGEAPIFLAGQIEIDPDNAKYAALNHVQFVGRGMLTRDPLCQTYDMAILGA